jgi:sulfite oxidase
MPSPAGASLVEREATPFNAETPLALLAELPTPTPLFYVRNHFSVPRVDLETWSLRVEGLVERPLELAFHEIRALPAQTLDVTLECAGNGRALMSPVPAGTPWEHGAVGTARFTGASLQHVLERAGLLPEVVELVFLGLDRGEVAPGRLVTFARSLPVEIARHRDVLLAWDMNGEPLTPPHGYPLRLLVPGWYGVASVKWLATISALPSAFDGYYQRERYVYVGEEGTAEGAPVSLMRVRAVIANPQPNATLPLGRVEVEGSAWSGAGEIRRVELGVLREEGSEFEWHAADMGEPGSTYAAVPWRFSWLPRSPGPHTLAARATDTAGNTQPLAPRWNRLGYGNNAVQRVPVVVA